MTSGPVKIIAAAPPGYLCRQVRIFNPHTGKGVTVHLDWLATDGEWWAVVEKICDAIGGATDTFEVTTVHEKKGTGTP